MGHGGYREGEIVARFSAEVEKPQKCPEGGNQLLRGRRPTLAGTFQKKVSYGMRIPLADILAERLEQIRSAASIMPESRLLHAAMRLKPVAERRSQELDRRSHPGPVRSCRSRSQRGVDGRASLRNARDS